MNSSVKYFSLVLAILIAIFARSSVADSMQDLSYLLKKGDYLNALKNGSSSEKDIIYWVKFYKGDIDKTDLSLINFYMKKFKNWPRYEKLVANIEKSGILSCSSKEFLDEWYSLNKPKTGEGRKVYLKFYKNKLKFENLKKIVEDTWINSNFSKKEEYDFLKEYRTYLTSADHQKRIDVLFYNKNYGEAERVLHLLPHDKQALYRLRIKINDGTSNAKKLILHADKNYFKNDGFLYDTLKFYYQIEDIDNLKKYLTAINGKGKENEQWCELKEKIARKFIDLNSYQLAYKVTSSGCNGSKLKVAILKWLSGWISLRYMEKPDLALNYFTEYEKLVSHPSVLAKARYWIGRTYEVKKEQEKASSSYKAAAKYFGNYYGQISGLKLNKAERAVFFKDLKITAIDEQNYKNNIYIKASVILAKSGYKFEAIDFIAKALESSKTEGEQILIAKNGVAYNIPYLGIESSKLIMHKNINLNKYNYPVRFSQIKDGEKKAITHAIIRQETQFDPLAISSAGARGLMQLMPTTAKEVASKLNSRFEVSKLHDSHYNVKLGSAYFDSLLNLYDGSYLLAVCAYNAGPGLVKSMIKNHGDPRKFKNFDEVIDWVEKIKYKQTRHYLQNVIEGFILYKSIILNKPYHDLSIKKELTK